MTLPIVTVGHAGNKEILKRAVSGRIMAKYYARGNGLALRNRYKNRDKDGYKSYAIALDTGRGIVRVKNSDWMGGPGRPALRHFRTSGDTRQSGNQGASICC